jgi:transcription initiation factor TFIID subunit TAF12
VSPEVEELLLDIGDDFLEHVAAGSAALARHRASGVLEASDVRLHVERVWGMPLPGHGAEEVEAHRPAAEVDAHCARLLAVRRTLAAAAAAAAAGTDR